MKKSYVRLISTYFAVDDGKLVRLGYREGNDTIRLVIGEKRERYIRDVDVKHMYLITFDRGTYGDTSYSHVVFSNVTDYRKYKPQMIDGEYVVDIPDCLESLGLTFRELDSKEFRRTKKFEANMELGELCSNAYIDYRRVYGPYDVYDMELSYKKGGFVIGDVDISHIYCRMHNPDSDISKLLRNSKSKKLSMDSVDFKTYIKEFTDYVQFGNFEISWEHGHLGRYSGEWHYCGIFQEDGEIKEERLRITRKDAHMATKLFGIIQCKSQKDYQNLISKLKLMGVYE